MRLRTMTLVVGVTSLVVGVAAPLPVAAGRAATGTEGSPVSIIAGEINWMGPTAFPSTMQTT
jgi:hypothetical protein